jgi:hypothetical protein
MPGSPPSDQDGHLGAGAGGKEERTRREMKAFFAAYVRGRGRWVWIVITNHCTIVLTFIKLKKKMLKGGVMAYKKKSYCCHSNIGFFKQIIIIFKLSLFTKKVHTAVMFKFITN